MEISRICNAKQPQDAVYNMEMKEPKAPFEWQFNIPVPAESLREKFPIAAAQR